MSTEKVLFVSKKDNLFKYLTRDYCRFYYGDEFCERLLPSEHDVKEILAFAEERCLPFTFVTPYVTENGLNQIKELLQLFPNNTEVVFNDWGVLRTIKRDFQGLIPVMGRLLTKIKRGPRLMNFIDRLPSAALDHLRKTNLGVPIYQNFLKKQDIKRVELDNPLQGLDFSDVPEGLHLSLYIPFAYVTTTRFCLVANCDKDDKKGFIGVFPCGRECRKYTFYLDNAVMKTLLIRRGNTIFYKNTRMPENIKNSQVDRIVISPEIPH